LPSSGGGFDSHSDSGQIVHTRCVIAVEQSACTASATRCHLGTVEMIAKNVNVWLAGPLRPVSEC